MPKKRVNPPTTLQEAMVALDKLLVKGDREYLAKAKDEHAAATWLHHTLGRHLRNEWGLWQNSALAEHMRTEHKIDHPDDMSHHIIVAYCRYQIPTRFQRVLAD